MASVCRTRNFYTRTFWLFGLLPLSGADVIIYNKEEAERGGRGNVARPPALEYNIKL